MKIHESFVITKDDCSIQLSVEEQEELYNVLRKKFHKESNVNYKELLKDFGDFKTQPIIAPNTNPYKQPNVTFTSETKKEELF